MAARDEGKKLMGPERWRRKKRMVLSARKKRMGLDGWRRQKRMVLVVSKGGRYYYVIELKFNS